MLLFNFKSHYYCIEPDFPKGQFSRTKFLKELIRTKNFNYILGWRPSAGVLRANRTVCTNSEQERQLALLFPAKIRALNFRKFLTNP